MNSTLLLTKLLTLLQNTVKHVKNKINSDNRPISVSITNNVPIIIMNMLGYSNVFAVN